MPARCRVITAEVLARELFGHFSSSFFYFLLGSLQHFFAFLPELQGQGSLGLTFPAAVLGCCLAAPPIAVKLFPST